MQLIDPALSAPAEILAVDEALLDWCETGGSGELLHFWEPREPFVVVGYANKVATEVNVPACEAAGIPIFRRCSGGGTVVQLPGGLNYSLILQITTDGPTRNITAANQFIMERNRAAIELAANTLGNSALAASISVRGHTDLCAGNVKFAGNSQRRHRNFLLFHGTLLLNCDLALISEYLRMPSLQPDYRAGRPHSDFVTNLNLPAAAVKAAFAKTWHALPAKLEMPMEKVTRLAQEKYSTREWNFKF